MVSSLSTDHHDDPRLGAAFLHADRMRFERLSEEERKLLLLACKVLRENLDRSLVLGWPVTVAEIRSMVRKLGGRADLL